MALESPNIDKRSSEDLLKEVKSLVPFYTPEWYPKEKDAGLALLKIFSYLSQIIIQRLNKMPEKNLVAFLDMLSIKLLPAQPASAPISFVLAEGTENHVLVPARTQIAAGDVVFETDKDILATPSKIQKAFSVDKTNDEICESPANVVSGEPVTPVQTELLYKAESGSKEIFLSSSEGLEKGDFLIIDKNAKADYAVISEISDSMVKLVHKLQSRHFAGSPVEKATSFELFKGKNLQEHIIYLGHRDLFNIKPAEGKPSKVKINIQLSHPVEESLELEWSFWGENDREEEDWIIVPESNKGEANKVDDATSGFSNDGVVTLTIDKEIKEKKVNEITNRWVCCRLNRSLFSKEELPVVMSIEIGEKQAKMEVEPDMVFHNDVPLDLTDSIYPFGKIPRLYDSFYIGSQEAFSKKEAEITLDVKLKENYEPSPQDLLLSWEYWNGEGWRAIKIMDQVTRDYKFETYQPLLTFQCPADIQSTEVNGQENYWIRISIANGDYGKEEYQRKSEYKDEVYKEWWEYNAEKIISPVINRLTIKYELPPQSLEHCLTYNNLEYKDVTEASKENSTKTFKPFLPLDDKHRTLYLGFDRKSEKGPISLFFSIEEQSELSEEMPAVEWQYYSDSNQWVRLEVLDDTKGLTISGIIECAFPLDFKKTKRFGQELY